MRAARPIAGALVIAAAAMTVVAFASGDGSPPAPAAAPAGPVRDGQAVWAEHGCGSCHALAAAGATGTFGPDLGQSLEGVPASSIEESIVAPAKVAAPGYSVGMMPEDYAARIAPGDLDALVGFLRASAGE